MKIALFMLLAFSSAGFGDFTSSTLVFRYDVIDGKCKDKNGNQGYNEIALGQLVEGKGGECGSFSSIGLTLTPTDIPDCQNHVPCKLERWNFQGADLNTLRTSGGPYCGFCLVPFERTFLMRQPVCSWDSQNEKAHSS